MWQLESDATNASSGSMFAGFEYGAGTTAGDGRRGHGQAAVERPGVLARVFAQPVVGRRRPSIRSSPCAVTCRRFLLALLHTGETAVVGPRGRNRVLEPATRVRTLHAGTYVGEGAALALAPAGVAAQLRARLAQIEAAVVGARADPSAAPTAGSRRGGGGVVGLPCQPPDGGGGGGGAGGGGVVGVPCQLDARRRRARVVVGRRRRGRRALPARRGRRGGGGGVVGVPCQLDAGGGGAAEGGAPGYFVPDTQQVSGTGAGTAFLSQQRAFGPCTPGLTYVNATHAGSFMQLDWQLSGLGAGRSKLW